MANNLRAIRKRIVSIKSTQQITKAMKMVAAAKLKRAQDKAVGSRPYLEAMKGVVSALSAGFTPENLPDLFMKREEKKVAVLIYTSNRGLCGAFNHNLIRHAEKLIETLKSEGKEVNLFHVGKKGYHYFRKRGYKIEKFYEDVKESISEQQAREVKDDLVASFRSGRFDRVILVYSKFHSAAVNRQLEFTLLPIERDEVSGEAMVIYEPDAAELMNKLLPEYVMSRTFNSLLESYASEQGARMSAMEAASKNAGDLLKSMTLAYNKARQALITQELIEITSSADALL